MYLKNEFLGILNDHSWSNNFLNGHLMTRVPKQMIHGMVTQQTVLAYNLHSLNHTLLGP
jgi:hypothetical protein